MIYTKQFKNNSEGEIKKEKQNAFDTSFKALFRMLLPIKLRNSNLLSLIDTFSGMCDTKREGLKRFESMTTKHIEQTGQVNSLNSALEKKKAVVSDIIDSTEIKIYSRDDDHAQWTCCLSSDMYKSGNTQSCPIAIDDGVRVISVVYNLNYLTQYFLVSYSDPKYFDQISEIVEQYRLVTKYPKYQLISK